MTRRLNINVEGRVRKIKSNDFLVSLYEAISNSIHAIEAQTKAGTIDVEILRAPRQLEAAATHAPGDLPITGFVISDTGIGFNDANMASFCEADSAQKAQIGGKGVGRFSWLKFFEKALVESTFASNEKYYHRSFVFLTGGIDGDDDVIEVSSTPGTIVRLAPLRIEYEPKTRKSLKEVSVAIVEHFLAYLVTESLPSVKIRDGAATQDIAELYRTNIAKNASRCQFITKGQTFNATCIRFFLGTSTHTGFLCGDKRVADRIMLGKRDQFLARRFINEDLCQYALYIFVQSDYLDKIVHDDRDGFRFPESGSLEALAPEAPTKDDITDEILKIAHSVLSEEIAKTKESNIKTVSSFVSKDAPQYRYVIAKHRDAIAVIHETEKVRIDQALRRIQFEEELQTRAEIGALMKQTEKVGYENEEWKKKSAELLTKLTEEGKANLAGYILQRKLILDVLQKRMEMADGSRAREEAIHQLIFPMGTESDDVCYEKQNLWMIDERLSYHYYLASDKALRTIPPAETDSGKEPDIIVFNRPIALYDRPESDRLESVIIIEFKRPGESSVDGQKNPVLQIQEYIELIQAGRAKTRKGRPISATDSTYFFGYVISELDPLLRKVLKRSNMKETPDGRGMFGFFEEHRAYIEVISYEKMLDDAMKRNRILFDKLQLPTQ